MGAGYINEETPETKALIDSVTRILLDNFPETPYQRWEYEDKAREIVRACNAYREHRVEL